MESKYDLLALRNQLCFPIYLCSKEIIRLYEKKLKRINLTYTQYIVMMYFWENKVSNIKEISKTLLLDSSTLTPLLIKLENKGYIIRKKATNDQRNLEVSITKKGMDIRDEALLILKEIGKCLNLNKEEAETLYKLIYKILVNVEGDIHG